MKLLVLCTEVNHSPLKALTAAATALALDAQIEQATSVGQLLISLQNTRYALTLLPAETRNGLIDSIRRVHPGVPLARYVSRDETPPLDKSLPQLLLEQLPEDLARVLGFHPADLSVTDELPALLEEDPATEILPAAPPDDAPETIVADSEIEFDENLLREVLAGLDVTAAVRQIMLIRDQRLQVQVQPNEPRSSDNGTVINGVARRGTTAPLDIEAAEDLAAQVAGQFRGADLSAQVHFFQEPGTEKQVIVYTRPAPGGYLLTLVAAPETAPGSCAARRTRWRIVWVRLGGVNRPVSRKRPCLSTCPCQPASRQSTPLRSPGSRANRCRRRSMSRCAWRRPELPRPMSATYATSRCALNTSSSSFPAPAGAIAPGSPTPSNGA